MAAQWDIAWSREMKRYYYMDKVHGKSMWSKPSNCDLELPSRPPKEGSRPKSPPLPDDLPPGWAAALDDRPEVNRYYFYRTAKPEIRTWFKPFPDAEEEEEIVEEHIQQIESRLLDMEGVNFQKGVSFRRGDLDFKFAIQLLRSEPRELGKKKLTEELLQDVLKSNDGLIEESEITVHLTKRVPSSEVMEALSSRTWRPIDQAPKVTFAESTLASATMLFHTQDPKRQICIVSSGMGEMPPELTFNQETELYCQVPALLKSLQMTSPSPVCPFGPAACASSNDPEEMSTVLYTPQCTICRGGVSQDFDLLSTTCTVPVLSIAIPSSAQWSAEEIEKCVTDSLVSAFATPVLYDPRCTTLIVGAWGCDRPDGPGAELVATCLAELLSGRKTVENIRIGWLYSEVHFCFPQHDASLGSVKEAENDAPIDVFRRIFDKQQLNPRLL